MAKVHKIDYSPDEFLGGVCGELTAVETGVYWMICTLIYSRRRPIPDDISELAGKFKKTDPRTVRAAVDRLVQCGKVKRDGGEMWVNRCLDELEMASNRIRSASENGLRGGRPSKKTNDLEKAGGLFSEKLSPSPSPSPESHPLGASRTPAREGPKPSRRKPETPLPDDWEPDRAYARGKGMTEATVDLEAEKFRDRQRQHDGRYRDWAAAWRTWCGSWVSYGRRQADASKPNGGRHGQRTEADDREAILAGLGLKPAGDGAGQREDLAGGRVIDGDFRRVREDRD